MAAVEGPFESTDQLEQILPGARSSEMGNGGDVKARPQSLLHRPCLLVAAGIKWVPVIFIASIISWSYYAFVVQLSIFTVTSYAEKALFLALYHFVLALLASSYWQTIFAPPSTAPSSWKLSAAMLERLNSAKSEAEWRCLLDLFVAEMQLPVLQRSVQGAVRYCEKCTAVKPDRSHHCSICGKCVLKMDHHCPWVNNCVAFNNYKFFVLFLAYALLYCVYVACCTFKYFLRFWTEELNTDGAGRFHILFLFFVSVMFCISVSSLFWYHVYLILRNKSTLEQFRAPHFDGVGADAEGWSLGRANNFMEVFGYNKLLWFLPVRTTIGDGLAFPTRLHCEVRTYQSTSDACVVNMFPADRSNGSNGGGVAAAPSSSHHSLAAACPQQLPNQVSTQLVLENDTVSTKVGMPRGLSYQQSLT